MTLHVWWGQFGQAVTGADELTPGPARDLASLLTRGTTQGATLHGIRQMTETGHVAIAIEIEVQRPQDLAYPIKAVETVAVVFSKRDIRPSVLALRADFPDTPHQNWTPPNAPSSLCIDDRPWSEAKLTASPADLVRRIQLWLAKAARGELHDPAQPIDPLFYVSELSVALPAKALEQGAATVELAGLVRNDNPQLIIARPLAEAPKDAVGFIVLAFHVQPQAMSRLRHAPATLDALATELERYGIKLYDELKNRLKEWAGIKGDSLRRLGSRLAIVVAFPVAEGSRTANDLRAFMTYNIAGEIGESLGVLFKNVGKQAGYVLALPENKPDGRDLKVEPAQVHFAFDRDLAASIAGHSSANRQKAVLVGGGSLGSQLALNLAREGLFSWTVVDQDFLLPHNLARHALLNRDVGAPKALALAHHIGDLLQEAADGLPCDVIAPDDASKERLNARLSEADIIIDASASVAVSRHLSDLPAAKARRVCVFFNPSGTSAVLLAEATDRSITLRDLEAQYHRLILTEPSLAGHLRPEGQGVRYSGSCRALTNRIPATKAALLSALTARGVVDCLKSNDAKIRSWNCGDDGSVAVLKKNGEAVHTTTLGGWSVSYDDGLLAQLATLRKGKLPNETGGALLGIADMSRMSLHIVHAMPQPEDSEGTPTKFERGVVGLLDDINRAVEATMHQLRYVGEWHSHPRLSSAWPSEIDLDQLAWLESELVSEGLPGLMAIAADDGKYSIIIRPTGSLTMQERG